MPDSEPESIARCDDCARPYGAEHGFPDLVIAYEYWIQISPTGDDGGLLCPCCMLQRLHAKGITCRGALMGGAVQTITPGEMHTLRRIENVELALAGRKNVAGQNLEALILQAVHAHLR